MKDGFLGPSKRIDRSSYQFFAAWRKNLKPYVVRNNIWSLHQPPCKFVIRVRSWWKGDFNFLITQFDQHLEKAPFLIGILRNNRFSMWHCSLRVYPTLFTPRLKKHFKRTIGSLRDWFPSRRSVDSHRGGFSIDFEGHWRLGRWSGLNGLYFVDGSLSLIRNQHLSKVFSLIWLKSKRRT